MTDHDHLSQPIRDALATDLTIDITTTGRRSGRPSRIEIWFMNVDGEIYITGTPGPRDWYANMLVNPAITFHLKESLEADLPATVEPVRDEQARRRVLTAMATAWYRSMADIDHLVAEAPLVRVRFS